MNFTESAVEDAGLICFGELSYAIDHGQHLTGVAISTLGDVFGLSPRISIPSSPNLNLSSPNLGISLYAAPRDNYPEIPDSSAREYGCRFHMIVS